VEEEKKGLKWRRGRFGWIAAFACGAFRDDVLLNHFSSFPYFVVGRLRWWFKRSPCIVTVWVARHTRMG
jgi:hypothetical protein